MMRLRLTLIVSIILVVIVGLLVGSRTQTHTLFLGDSILAGWTDLAGIAGENGAVSGYTSYDVLFRYHTHYIDHNYTAYVVLVGGNDFNSGISIDAMHDNLRALLWALRRTGKPVFVGSLLPTMPGVRAAELVLETNTWLRNLAAQYNLTYVDYYSALVGEDGHINPQYVYDDRHPNAAGYEQMGKLLREAIGHAA